MTLDPIAIGKQIKQSFPQYANVDEATLGNKYLTKYGGAVSSIQSGQIKITDIPEAQRVGVSIGLQGTGYEPPEKANAAEVKKNDSFNAAINFIGNLEQQYTESKGGEYAGIGAIIGGTKKNIAGALNLDKKAKVYNRSRKGFTASLRDLTGDVGVLTEQDYQRIADLLPKFTDDPQVAKDLFNQLRSQISAKYGGEETKTEYQQPELKGGALGKSGNPILELVAGVAPETSEYATETVPEYYAKGYQGYGKQLEERSRIKQEAEKVQSEIGTLSALLGLGGSAINKVKSLGKGAALQARQKVAQETTTKISGSDMLAQAEKRLGSVSEVDKGAVTKMFETAKKELAGKSFTAEQALEKLAQYNKAYSTTGAAGKSAKAFFNDVMSKSTREVIGNVAPEVAVAQEALKRSMQLPKDIRRILGYGGVAAGGIGGGAYLLSLLTGKNKR